MMLVSNNLSFSPLTPRLPSECAELDALAEHVRAGRCALFVGAGLSVPAGLPTWSALMERLVEQATPWAVDPQLFASGIEMTDIDKDIIAQPDMKPLVSALGDRSLRKLCNQVQKVKGGKINLWTLREAVEVLYRDSSDRAELTKLSDAKRYTEMAEHCRARLGRTRFHELIREALSSPSIIPPTHLDIVRTPFSCIVTTNFDSLLEQAYVKHAGFLPRAPTGAELGQQGTLLLDRAFYILKAHGDATRPETMVFTADDYRRIIHATPAFQAIMSGILMTHAVLFVGYSLSDPNFRLLLDNQLTVFNGHVPPRYALLEGVGDAEADVLWRTSKLQVLSYPPKQHQEVGRFLKLLADEVAKPPPVAPNVKSPQKTAGCDLTLYVQSDGTTVSYELAYGRGGKAVRLVSSGLQPTTPEWGQMFRNADNLAGKGLPPLATIRAIGKKLAAALPADLKKALRSSIPADQTLEIACSQAAMRVPWEWLDSGNGPICARRAIVRRPVAISHQARGRRFVGTPLRALIIGDAGDAGQNIGLLDYAELEAQAIEKLIVESDWQAFVKRLSREEATRDRVLTELEQGQYDLFHFGGHAWFSDQDAVFCLWDRLVFGSELVSLFARKPPAFMFLNTHYTAFVMSEVDAPTRDLVSERGDSDSTQNSPRGFAEAAMRSGISSFVGAFGTVADRPAAEFAVTFYDYLLRGNTVGEALLRARRYSGPAANQSGLFYTAFGYPDFRLVAPSLEAKGISRSRVRIMRQLGW